MSLLDLVLLVETILVTAQTLLTTQILGYAVWILILITWPPVGFPLGLLFTRFVYIRHGRPFNSREKRLMVFCGLGGWATLIISVFYILPLAALFLILAWFFKSRPITFIVSWLLLPVKLVFSKAKTSGGKIKKLLFATSEKFVDVLFPTKTS